MTIDKLIKDVLKKEGGFVNDPVDKGGPTNMGITQKTLSAYMQRKVTVDEVKNLSPSVAVEIYKNEYYLKPRINLLPKHIQPVVFDTAVNSGPKAAIALLQRILTDNGYPLEDDGKIGPKTLKACNAFISDKSGGELVREYVAARIERFHLIVANNPEQGRFINGWVKRANSFLTQG